MSEAFERLAEQVEHALEHDTPLCVVRTAWLIEVLAEIERLRMNREVRVLARYDHAVDDDELLDLSRGIKPSASSD